MKTRPLTLRQFTNFLVRYLGRDVGAYAYVRALQEAGQAEFGKAGRGGVRCLPVTPAQAVLMLLAALTGNRAKEAVGEALILRELVCQHAARSVTDAAGGAAVPIQLGGLEGLPFGVLIAALLDFYRNGGIEERVAGQTAAFGIHFGQDERGPVGTYECRGADADGRTIVDVFVFGPRIPFRPRGARRTVFVPIDLIRHVAQALRPSPDAIWPATRVENPTNSLSPVIGFGIGSVGSSFPNGIADFPTIGSA